MQKVITVIGIAAWILGVVVIAAKVRNAPAEVESSARAQLIEAGVSPHLVDSAGTCLSLTGLWLEGTRVPRNCSHYPVELGKAWSGTVVLGELESYNGLWTGINDPVFYLDHSSWQPDSVRTRIKNWGDSLLGNPSEEPTDIWLKVSLPAAPRELVHQPIAAFGSIDVRYPGPAEGFFKNYSTTVEREFSFYLVTADEMTVLKPTFWATENATLVGTLYFAGGLMLGAVLLTRWANTKN